MNITFTADEVREQVGWYAINAVAKADQKLVKVELHAGGGATVYFERKEEEDDTSTEQ